MFRKKTVFVVGAGASYEVGLPVGNDLKIAIGKKVNLSFKNGWDMSSGDPNIMDAIRVLLDGRDSRDVNPHCYAGRIIASTMHQALSIDNPLHAHSENELIVEMGKLGIAATILEAERASKIYTGPTDHDRINFNAHPDIWHNTFCKMLTESVQKKDIQSLFENVAFITFNYDRCIEHYVFNWLSNYFNITTEEAQSLTSKLTVIHPYGQIGRLPWQKLNLTSVRYGAPVDAQTLPKIARHIRTFTEQVEDPTIVEQMKDLLTKAEQVVFLGFSYGAMNLQLMQVDQYGPIKVVRGTALGISDANLRAIQSELQNVFGSGTYSLMGTNSFEKSTCYKLMEDYFRTLV